MLLVVFIVVSGAQSTVTGVLGNPYPAAESLRVSDVSVPATTDEGLLIAGLPTAVVGPIPVDIRGYRFASASASFVSGGRR